MDFSLEGARPIERAGPDQRYVRVAVRGRSVSIDESVPELGRRHKSHDDVSPLALSAKRRWAPAGGERRGNRGLAAT
jgi:hypothetical protein